jgi:maltose/moltooligosaccharide transporter
MAWASILSMPYAILSTAIPANRMGVYMGIFNFFIVLPEIVASLFFGPVTRLAFGQDNPNAPLYWVTIGGGFLVLAAVAVSFVRDEGRDDAREREAELEAPERAAVVPAPEVRGATPTA